MRNLPTRIIIPAIIAKCGLVFLLTFSEFWLVGYFTTLRKPKLKWPRLVNIYFAAIEIDKILTVHLNALKIVCCDHRMGFGRYPYTNCELWIGSLWWSSWGSWDQRFCSRLIWITSPFYMGSLYCLDYFRMHHWLRRYMIALSHCNVSVKIE